MNIFYLDHDPVKAAEYHCDKHVVKMILESVQIISTVANRYGIEAPYKPTHKNHPCVLWAGESYKNIIWLADLLFYLNTEYKYRYGCDNNHMSYNKTMHTSWLNNLICSVPEINFTVPPQCMPEQYRQADTVEAYRAYYNFEKRHIHKWTKREEPYWLVKL